MLVSDVVCSFFLFRSLSRSLAVLFFTIFMTETNWCCISMRNKIWNSIRKDDARWCNISQRHGTISSDQPKKVYRDRKSNPFWLCVWVCVCACVCTFCLNWCYAVKCSSATRCHLNYRIRIAAQFNVIIMQHCECYNQCDGSLYYWCTLHSTRWNSNKNAKRKEQPNKKEQTKRE